ncbi:hypothetical protein ATE80_06915 [Streptomyces kanasensis]|uniref:Uncharacterized protein n=1 Tax=Streptomyces kanasensis TaxID=936756 RepID=A0A100Y882_9ACTN|nr:hypothetical protein ATE80_06915 [Streptomyces kanasensis]
MGAGGGGGPGGASTLRARVLLGVAVAVTAVSGCVSVAPPPGPAHVPAAGHPTRDPEPLVVEAPAREALESTGPVPRPAARPAPSGPPRPWTAQRRTEGAARPGAPRGGAGTERAGPGHRKRAGVPVRAVLPVPLPVRTAVRVPDACGLAERYGAWRPGGQEARRCRETARR